MTTPTENEEDPTEVDEIAEEATKTPPIAKKVSRFGPAGFQNGSKFGK